MLFRLAIYRWEVNQNMAEDLELQIKQLDEQLKKAKNQAEKDLIKERQAELKRQLESSKKK